MAAFFEYIDGAGERMENISAQTSIWNSML